MRYLQLNGMAVPKFSCREKDISVTYHPITVLPFQHKEFMILSLQVLSNKKHS